jgi:S1-C subfamily serine protease
VVLEKLIFMKKILHYFRNRRESLISQIVILSALFGFTAGIVGQTVTDAYLDPWKQDYINAPLLDEDQINQGIPELRRVTRFLGTEQDLAINQAVQKAKPALVGVYAKKNTAGVGLLQQLYTPTEILGNGFLLTNDGWLVTHASAIGSRKENQLAVVYKQKAYDVSKVILDESTGVIFLKTNINNASVAVLGDSNEAFEGQLMVALGVYNVQVSTISSIGYPPALSNQDFVLSSDQFAKKIALADILSSSFSASPVVNLAGEVVGIITEVDNESLPSLVPINQFRSIMLDVLRDSEIIRPVLGISYIDLAHASGLQVSRPDNIIAGALVYQQPIVGTPASNAGIKANDIIISANQEPLSEQLSLAQIILQYQPGDEIDFEIFRNGELIQVTAVLE